MKLGRSDAYSKMGWSGVNRPAAQCRQPQARRVAPLAVSALKPLTQPKVMSPKVMSQRVTTAAYRYRKQLCVAAVAGAYIVFKTSGFLPKNAPFEEKPVPGKHVVPPPENASHIHGQVATEEETAGRVPPGPFVEPLDLKTDEFSLVFNASGGEAPQIPVRLPAQIEGLFHEQICVRNLNETLMFDISMRSKQAAIQKKPKPNTKKPLTFYQQFIRSVIRDEGYGVIVNWALFVLPYLVYAQWLGVKKRRRL